jgi:hypothetical protein
MWNETRTFRAEFSRKIRNGPRFKMRWNLFHFVPFFELVWNVSAIPGETEHNWQPWLSVLPIVFKPSPVQGLVPGFDRVVRVGRVNPYFKKIIQNGVPLVKKKQTKINGLQPSFWPGRRVNPPGRSGHAGSWLILFFYQASPVPALGRPGRGSTRRVGPGFKTMVLPNNTLEIWWNLIGFYLDFILFNFDHQIRW